MASVLQRTRWRSAYAGIAIWLGIMMVTAVAMHFGVNTSVRTSIAGALLAWGSVAITTPFAFWMARQFPIGQNTWLRNGALHLACGILVVMIGGIAFAAATQSLRNSVSQEIRQRVQDRTGVAPPPSRPVESIMRTAAQNSMPSLLIYFFQVILAQSMAASAALRRKELLASALEASLARAQLSSIRAQLQPHFLFNTLNSIAVLVPKDPIKARTMVLDLADLLRMTIQESQRDFIPLSEELKLLSQYVEIQKIRFGERLRFSLSVEPSVDDLLVPTMLLQPIVENAIKHGVESSEKPENVVVTAGLRDGFLIILVTNPIPDPEPARQEVPSTGVGLRNTRARLEAHYPGTHEFQAAKTAANRFDVFIRLPQTRSS
jgi:LytS/YehU family sensor histidine kinase